jgi:hypothetical protein
VTASNYIPWPEVNYFSQFFPTPATTNAMNSVVNPRVVKDVIKVEEIPKEDIMELTEEDLARAAAYLAYEEELGRVEEENNRQWEVKMAIRDLIFQTQKPLENLTEIAAFRLDQANRMAKRSFDYSFIYEREYVEEIFKKADDAMA